MKKYTIRQKEETCKYGDVVFEWADGHSTVKSCIQHRVQPALFFEELLQEAGYERVDDLYDLSTEL